MWRRFLAHTPRPHGSPASGTGLRLVRIGKDPPSFPLRPPVAARSSAPAIDPLAEFAATPRTAVAAPSLAAGAEGLRYIVRPATIGPSQPPEAPMRLTIVLTRAPMMLGMLAMRRLRDAERRGQTSDRQELEAAHAF